MIKDFIIGSVFEKIDTLKIRGKANDFPTEPTNDYVLPLLTAGIENQGLARYAKRKQCPTILSNCISVSANGENSGVVFYHPEEFAVLQDAYAIRVRNYTIPNEAIGLYLASSLYKAIATTHDWNYKAGWNRIKEDIVSLPIKIDKNGEPITDDTHFYHEEGFVPDFDYMQECIEKLEQKHIKELGQYLATTGLDDCELTNEDIATLTLCGFKQYKESDSKNTSKIRKEMREFRCGDILTKYNPKFYGKPNTYVGRKAHTTTEPDKKHTIPLTCAKYDNNGIMYYGETGLFETVSNCLVMIRDGAVSTGLVFAHKDPISVLSHSYLMICKEKVGFHTLQYIATTMTKILYPKYDRGTPSIWKNRVENDYIPLPIRTDDNNMPIIDSRCKYHHDGYIPDWDFMEKYIKAIEKTVISNVVKYKDTMKEPI